MFLLGFASLIILASLWQIEQGISNIEVYNLSYLPKDEILSIIEPNISDSSMTCSLILKDIEDEILKNPYIYDVNITSQKACSLKVKIIERIPIGYFQRKDGSLFYIDTTGKIIPYRYLMDYCDLPVLQSKSRKINSDSAVANSAAKILVSLNKKKYNKFNYKISELVYTDTDSTFYFYSISNKKKFLFGRAEFIEQKLNTLNKYFASELYQRVLTEPFLVDIRWKNKVVLSQL